LPNPQTSGDNGRAAIKRYPDAALAIFRSIRKLKDDGLDTAAIRDVLYSQTPDEIWETLIHAAPPLEVSQLEFSGESAEPIASVEETADEAATAESLEAAVLRRARVRLPGALIHSFTHSLIH
ncbi:hypothetical protein O7047_22290, partial [Pseudenterobacter timonensis]